MGKSWAYEMISNATCCKCEYEIKSNLPDFIKCGYQFRRTMAMHGDELDWCMAYTLKLSAPSKDGINRERDKKK